MKSNKENQAPCMSHPSPNPAPLGIEQEVGTCLPLSITSLQNKETLGLSKKLSVRLPCCQILPSHLGSVWALEVSWHKWGPSKTMCTS